MNLVLAARTQESLERAASELQSAGTRVLTVPTDVTDLEQLQSLVDSAFHEFGSIEVLVNNAGIESHRDFHQFTSNEIVQTVQFNLLATMQLTRLVLPYMFNAHRGHIVNVASIAGKGGPPFGAAYAASKAG
jgi:short-subunit dehydrogenase